MSTSSHASETVPSGSILTQLAPELNTMIAAARREAELKFGFALAVDRAEPQQIDGKLVLRVFWRKAESPTGQPT